LDIHKLYQPTAEERSRQAFVGAFKTEINQALEPQLNARYENVLLPEFRQQNDRDPEGRREGKKVFESDRLYRLWESATYKSQNLLWESVGDTVDRVSGQFDQRAAEIDAQATKKGSLTLAPASEKPHPIDRTEVHRQPGGYFLGDENGALTAALLYMGTTEIYRAAKGFSSNDSGSTDIGHQFAAMVEGFAPGLKPRRILDVGCGVGHMAIGLKEAFPEAEVVGIDLSASFVRLGHLWAEDMGVAVDFLQGDAAHTGLEAGSFDLIVSQILFHETWHDKLPAIMAEAHRLLSGDGLFFNVDIPYQPARLNMTQLVTNAWQVRHNGEPFWTGFADTDVQAALENAGFGERAFATYAAPGGGREYFIFGARGPERAGDREEVAA
jgi:SAM-dependent methyltransferase